MYKHIAIGSTFYEVSFKFEFINIFEIFLVYLNHSTGEKLTTFFLFQSISMAIQKGNAVWVMGCPKNRSSGLEGLFNFQAHEAEEVL